MIHQLGFDYYQANHHTWCLTTPHTFSSGRPVSFYLSEHEDHYLFDDYAMNYYLFSDTLPNPEKAEHILRTMLKDNIVQFKQHRLIHQCHTSELIQATSEYLQVLARLVDYEYKPRQMQAMEDIMMFIEQYLKQSYEQIIAKPYVKGLSGIGYHFDYQAGQQYIDYCTPQSDKTGAILRKILDVSNSNHNAKFQIILDDRESLTHFKREAGILSPLASVLPASRLMC